MKICFFGAYDKNFTSNQIVLKGLRQVGVDVVEVNSHTPLTKLDQKNQMSTFELVKRVLRKRKIVSEIIRHWTDLKTCDFIYVGFPGHFDVIIAYPLALLLRKKIVFNPLVVFYTGFVDDQGFIKEGSLFARVIKLGETLVYKMSSVVLADTNLQKKHLHSFFGVPNKKIRVLPIGADDAIYKYSPKKKGTKFFNVVYYGLYTPLHGVEYILDAAGLCLRDKSIRFLMVGKGNKFEETFKDAKKRKLTNIIFYPEMTEIDAFETLAEADIFLGFLQKHPSVERIVPNKVYQGLALGKAVVTGDTAITREFFIHKKNIFLCNLADGQSLAHAILTLKADNKLREKIAKNGHELFKSRFTPTALGNEMVRILADFK